MRCSAAVLLLAVSAAAFAGDELEPKPVDWRAAAAQGGLVPGEVDRLAKQKVLVAGPELKQSFEPYTGSRTPAFVTSDSVLNAYHVLLEESVVRLEQARAAQLPAVLRPMWDGLPAAAARFDLPKDVLDDAVRRARILVGTALRVATGGVPGPPADVAALIESEAAHVVQAKERTRPAWLGPPDAGFPFVDYTRCEPRSFYVRDKRLAAYFRAVVWLQSVPLRLDREPELLTALLLGEALRPGTRYGRAEPYTGFVDAWESMLGRYGDLPLPAQEGLAEDRWTRELIARYRDGLREDWEKRSLQRADPLHGVEPCVRVLPAATLPDGALFDRCCPASGAPRYPSGLFVAAALGGTFARDESLRGRPGEERDRIAREIDAMRGIVRPEPRVRIADDPDAWRAWRGGLYGRYLTCVATLLDPPDPAAPALFASDAWQAKSTNAALAAWAQMRHTWVLQARESLHLAGGSPNCAGFVEPNPRFFSRLSDLVQQTAEFLEASGAFDAALARREAAWLIEDYASVLRRPASDTLDDLTAGERSAINLAPWFLGELGFRVSHEDVRGDPEAIAKKLAAADGALRVLSGDAPLPPKCAEAVASWSRPLRDTWLLLERTCRRLHAMAEKQLRGAAWDDDETEFLLDYGVVLARAMRYEGNSYLHPRDDAPRATSVYACLGGSAPGFLHAAIARPRLLWVLYPWQGREILTVGTVLPYREFVRGERLTDAAWRSLLDSPDAPPAPEWWDRVAEPVRASEK